MTVWFLDETGPGSGRALRARVRAALSADPSCPDGTPTPGGTSTSPRHHPGRGRFAGAPDPRCGHDGVEPEPRVDPNEPERGLAGSADPAETQDRRTGCGGGRPSPDPHEATPPALADHSGGRRAQTSSDLNAQTDGPHTVLGPTSRQPGDAALPRARCVLLDIGTGAVGASRLDRALSRVGPGDILAVFTLSYRVGRSLRDLRPAVVAAVVDAGLQHLQHIVTITRDPAAPTATGVGVGVGSGWVLGPDVTLFRRPDLDLDTHLDPGPGSGLGHDGAHREARG